MTFSYLKRAGVATAAVAMALVAGAADGARAQEGSEHVVSRVKNFINLLDFNGDGAVSQAEIAAEQGRLFAAADVDGDGSLSVAEFRRRGSLILALNATTFFDMMDTDGDATLALDEITGPAARWVARYDVDASGALDREEIEAARGSGGR